MATPPPTQEDVQPQAPAPSRPPQQQGTLINLGSQSVIGIKAAAAVLAIIVLIWYVVFISYPESSYWTVGLIFGVIGIGLGVAGVFIGNLKISRKRYVPTLNIILIIVSIIFLFMMPLFGSWEDPRTIGGKLWDVGAMIFFLIFAILMLCYIELAHASIRFSQIDDYATSHNLREFNVNSVIANYFLWFGILISIITVISLVVLLMQVGLSGFIRDVAPQFGYSLEYNSIYSILISIALVFVPIGIILSFVFGYFVKSKRSIVVKSREDIVARRPEEVRTR
jgi:hypothetical protein